MNFESREASVLFAAAASQHSQLAHRSMPLRMSCLSAAFFGPVSSATSASILSNYTCCSVDEEIIIKEMASHTLPTMLQKRESYTC